MYQQHDGMNQSNDAPNVLKRTIDESHHDTSTYRTQYIQKGKDDIRCQIIARSGVLVY